MTFSIVARSEDGQSWGVAVASRFLAVGSMVPAAVAGVGAVATQANANVAFKGLALAHLDEGATAEIALATLLEDDESPEQRQVGIVDAEGSAAAHTGSLCQPHAGHLTGPGVSVQGNLLAGPEVLSAMEAGWAAAEDEPSLARRLLTALHAGDRAGGDLRGRQSAALFVVRDGAGYEGGDDVATDLRVDDHPDPVAELERLLSLSELYLSEPPDEDRLDLDEVLREELEQRARDRGHGSFLDWVGFENYEMRVGPGWVDQRVVALLRGVAQ